MPANNDSQSLKKISITIPVFNEASNVESAIDAVERVFREKLSRYTLEIIVTDNASTDATWQTVTQLALARPHMTGYRFSRNFGYQNSVFAGLSLATGDAVIEMDADLEDPPEVIPQFVEKWEQGFDVVYGVRSKRHGSWLMRVVFSLFYWLLNRLSELPIPRNAGDFRLLDRRVVDRLRALPERNLYLRGLVVYLGFKQVPVTYERQPRASGSSKFRFFHYVILAIDAITAFTKAPLRLIGALGFTLFALAMATAVYYLVTYLRYGTPIQGFTTLVILMLLLNSITFMFLGVLGEYLSRIFDDSKMRPRVVIAESTSSVQFPREL
jgi:dolichol-phosphate mannosyltransferase